MIATAIMGCASDPNTDPALHAITTCDSGWMAQSPPITKCEVACMAYHPLGDPNQEACMNGTGHPCFVGDTFDFDGVRGCCRPDFSSATTVERFAVCR